MMPPARASASPPPVRLTGPLAAALRAEAPALAVTMVDAVTQSVPEYAGLDEAARAAVQRTAQAALGAFIDRLEGRPGRAPAPPLDWRPGMGAWRSGRSLDALQAAFRVAARAAWEGMARTAVQAGLDAESVSRLAGALFAAVEQASAQATEAYARAQAQAAGERMVSRARLAALLVRDPPVGVEALERAAQAAGWRLPRRLSAIALADEHDPHAVAGRIGPDALSSDEAHCVIVPDPEPARRRRLVDRACIGFPAAVGPPVDPEGALRSLAWARETLALVLAGRLPAVPAPRAEENLLALALARGSDLLDALAARLGLEDRAVAEGRIDLETTLLTWLRLDRSATAAAAVLHLHPQTVRYRVARARELLGPVLDDPSGRFELETVLHARRELGH
ncbi:MAG TPA: helix-turn-helix domain-containing protein [Solirubrobacteraceae bacterium]|nr:helix-turn-helix domain-containing protein [Solirubrobacteraceae bacterium]